MRSWTSRPPSAFMVSHASWDNPLLPLLFPARVAEQELARSPVRLALPNEGVRYTMLVYKFAHDSLNSCIRKRILGASALKTKAQGHKGGRWPRSPASSGKP